MVSSLKAWLCYMRHPARDAGLGLAFLYMTVLGFDNITWGYCLNQCVTESVLGATVGVSAIFGVLGSVTFPFLRKRVGLNRSGVVGTIFQTTALSMCVISVWLVGSPFDINYFQKSDPAKDLQSFFLEKEMTNQMWNSTDVFNDNSTFETSLFDLKFGNLTNETSLFDLKFDNSTDEMSFFELGNNLTTTEMSKSNDTTDPIVDSPCYVASYASGFLLKF